ncbi:Uncharacterised protein [Enterobacter cloacae]|uniref:Uncharacterized protein n=1 Tax=Enterobacter cloacae TaxID=550 RepID=A0A377M1U9_ENTCL|nr:Uncharacterised protein [Enterobacter cloacae]
MRLTVRLLMRIYQGASLSWHWSAGVLATVVFGSCCAVKGFMLIHKRVYRLYHLSGPGRKTQKDVVKGWQQNVCRCSVRRRPI